MKILSLLSLFSLSASALSIQLKEGKIIELNYFPQADFLGEREQINAERDYKDGIQSFAHLGMNGVPVLDQGQYGTCVTFSTTAAMDALVTGTDYISQQCTLELKKALSDNIWNGAYYPSQVIDPLKTYGAVSKAKCPRQYPMYSARTTVSAYKKLADTKVLKGVEYAYRYKPSVDDMKVALNKGHRVLIGFLLDGSASEAVMGFNVKLDGVAHQGGLWACQQRSSPNYCTVQNAGHEVVVIGYDDVQRLFRIRNSWNTDVGANGDYFMTYEFFTAMVIDSTEVW